MIHSYPSIRAFGHAEIKDLLDGEVLIEEKIDGSQLSFGVIDGELRCRSKGAQLNLDAPEKLFSRAVEVARGLAPQLPAGIIYRTEFLSKPKHNTLGYERIPKNHLVLFDVEAPGSHFSRWTEKRDVAERLGLDVAPALYEGPGADVTQEFLLHLLKQQVSLLGGPIEGVVIKNYSHFTADGKVMVGKLVSEDFKETHRKDWKDRNPTRRDVVTLLVEEYRTPVRWAKAIQHLRECGLLEKSPRDIGKLLAEVQGDVEKECAGEIKEALFRHFWPQVRRGIIAGFPEWYKTRLLTEAFTTEG